MGLDLGKHRIGIAIADDTGLGVRPLSTLLRSSAPRDHEALRAIVADWQVRRVVVGLPLNMDGSEGPAARHARRFAEQLARIVGLPVSLYDERLTSFEARSRLQELPIRRGARKPMVDQMAAALILEGWLAEHGSDSLSGRSKDGK